MATKVSRPITPLYNLAMIDTRHEYGWLIIGVKLKTPVHFFLAGKCKIVPIWLQAYPRVSRISASKVAMKDLANITLLQ